MLEAYKIGIRISLINKVSAGLAMMAKEFGSTGKAAAALQNRIDGIRLSMTRGGLMLGVGSAIAAPLIFAIDKAAELQKQMIGVRLATAGTQQEMDKLRAVIERTASQTIFSNIDVAKMGKIIATGTGVNSPQLMGLLPQYAKFADVQYLMKGTSYTQSVTEAIRLAHTAKKYDPESLAKYLDLLTKVSLIVPGNLSEVGHALKYSQGIANTALGVSDDQMVLLTALLNRLGFAGSRGGTNLIAAMTRTIPGIFGSGLLAGKSGAALRNMGMADASGHSKFLSGGKFDAMLWMRGLSDYVHREMVRNPEGIARQNIMKNFQHAFGTQGARVASLLADPQALTQLSKLGETFSHLASTGAMQSVFANESVSQKWMNAHTNFVSAMTELGYTLLPLAAKVLTKLNTGLQHLIDWITKNQTAVRLLTYALVGLSAGLMIRGSVILLAAAFKGLGMAMVFNQIGGIAGIVKLSTALTGIGGALGVLTAAAGTFLAAYAGWKAGGWINEHLINPAVRGLAGNDFDTLGTGLYSWLHPHDANRGYMPGTRRSGGTIQNNIHIDGRKFATVMTEHQSRSMFGPQRGSSTFDVSMMPPTVGMPIR